LAGAINEIKRKWNTESKQEEKRTIEERTKFQKSNLNYNKAIKEVGANHGKGGKEDLNRELCTSHEGG